MYNTKEMTINKRVAFYRRMKNMRQEDLADKLGMVHSTYSRMEREGKLTVEKINLIAAKLEISPDLLYHGEVVEEKKKADETNEANTPTESEESKSDYDFSPTEKTDLLKQTTPPYLIKETVRSSEIEQACAAIRGLKAENKRKVIDFINKLKKEELEMGK